MSAGGTVAAGDIFRFRGTGGTCIAGGIAVVAGGIDFFRDAGGILTAGGRAGTVHFHHGVDVGPSSRRGQCLAWQVG